MKTLCTVFVWIVVVLAVPAAAFAGTVTLSNGSQSGTIEYAFGTDEMKMVVTNTTATTRNAGDLLTGIQFTLYGVDKKGDLTAAIADAITVAKDCSTTSAGNNVDLLTAGKNGKPTWSLTNVSKGVFLLTFNPDAMYAIIGPPESNGTYSKANSSICGNPGHNPYADQEAGFMISIDGIDSSTKLVKPVLFFGTDLGTSIPPVPLPSAVWTGLAMLGGLAILGRRRQRNRL